MRFKAAKDPKQLGMGLRMECMKPRKNVKSINRECGPFALDFFFFPSESSSSSSGSLSSESLSRFRFLQSEEATKLEINTLSHSQKLRIFTLTMLVQKHAALG